ncbi:MAG: hypothetical protein QNK85_01390 [Crocinitomicaceae bacterium]
MRQIFSIILIFFFSAQVGAQNITPKYTFNMDIGLPIATGNEPFKDIMQGLLCTNIYGQYSFPFQLNVGLGMRYSLFTIDEFAINEENNGQIHTGATFIKIGYDQFHTERFSTDFGVKVGYSWNYANTDLNKVSELNHKLFTATLIEPTIGLILSADERNSYRWNVGYCIHGYGFSPSRIGLSSNAVYDVSKFGNLTNYFVVGFGYTHYFRNKTPN